MFARMSHPLEEEERGLMREVLAKLHPDQYSGHDREKEVNAENLLKLNKYVEELQTSGPPKPIDLEFFIYNEKKTELKPVKVKMDRGGDLSQLFLALGLIEPTSKKGTKSVKSNKFFSWMKLEFERHFDKQGFRV